MTGPVQQFRRNAGRTGQNTESVRTPVRLYKRVAPLNLGIHSASKSSPVADETGLYLGTDTGRFLRVSWAGDIVWEYKVAGTDKGIHGSAIVGDNDVWIGAYNGMLYRLDKKTGAVIWMVSVGETIGSSPLYIDRKIYVTIEWNERPNGGLVKVDAETGKIVWRTPLLGEQIHSSASFDEENQAIVFGSNHGALFSYDLDGKLRWIVNTGDAIKSTPAITAGKIFVTSWDGFLYRIDGKTGQKVWKAGLSSSSQSSPSLVPELDQVLVGDDDGHMKSFDIATGRLIWSSEFEGQITGSAAVFSSEKGIRIAIGCQIGTLCLFDEKGKLIQEIDTRSQISGEPGIYQKKIFAASDRHGLWIWE